MQVDEPTGSEVEPQEEALTTALNVNFEGSPLGALGAPWSISKAGASSASIVSTTDHGRVLELKGSPTLGDFFVASLGFSSSASELTAQVAIRPTANAAFVYSVNGAGSSIGARRIRLQRSPGSTQLVAQTSPSGSTTCGTLANDAWSKVTLLVHGSTFPHTFDVRINGAATSCTHVSTGLSAPFTSVSVMDASNESWGGSVRFDDILVTSP
jgi:polyisoprenoid-binding protein YceI